MKKKIEFILRDEICQYLHKIVSLCERDEEMDDKKIKKFDYL
jgi:hypothetical protein